MSEIKAWSRLEFVRVATLAASALRGGPLWLLACDRTAPPPPDAGPGIDAGPPPAFDLPSLGGAPDTEEGRTIAALVERPGSGRIVSLTFARRPATCARDPTRVDRVGSTRVGSGLRAN